MIRSAWLLALVAITTLAVASDRADRGEPMFRLAATAPSTREVVSPGGDGMTSPRASQRGLDAIESPLDGEQDRDGAAELGGGPSTPPVAAGDWDYAVTPPPGFVRSHEQGPSRVVESHHTPSDDGSFVVARFEHTAAPRDLLRHTVAAYTRGFETFRVVEVEPLAPSIAGERWLLELEATRGQRTVRHLQVYASAGRDVIVLSYSAPSAAWAEHAPYFHRSIATLEMTPRAPAIAPPTPAPAEPASQRRARGLRDTLRGLLDGVAGATGR